MKLDPCLSPCTSINSKWIKDLNIRPKTLKLVQKGAGNTLENINFLKLISQTQTNITCFLSYEEPRAHIHIFLYIRYLNIYLTCKIYIYKY
jgi:hypothetical protein